MNDDTGHKPPWVEGRRGSDASHVTLDELFEAMKHSGPYDPHPVTFETHGSLLIDDAPGVLIPDEITIELFITAVRVVMHPDYDYPEWQFEGWVKDDQPERTWLRGVLRVVKDQNEELEVGLYRLEPGEEWGDSPTPGFE